MEKKYKNINEEVDRIKKLFTEERLYGNLIIETPINSKVIDDLFKVADDFYELLIKNKSNIINDTKLKNVSEKINSFKNVIPTLHKSFNIFEDGIKILDPNNVDNITKKITDEYRKIFDDISDSVKVKTETGIETNFKTLIHLEINKISKSYNDINTAFFNKIKEIQDKRQKFPDELSKEINEIYPGFGDKLKKLYNPMLYQIEDVIKSGLKKIFNNRKNYYEKLKKISNNPAVKFLVPFLNSIKSKKITLTSALFDYYVKMFAYRSFIGVIYCEFIWLPENDLKDLYKLSGPTKPQYDSDNNNRPVSLEWEIFKYIMISIGKFISFPLSKVECGDTKEMGDVINKFIDTLEIDDDTKKIGKDKVNLIFGQVEDEIKTMVNDVKTESVKISSTIEPYVNQLSPEQKDSLDNVLTKLVE